MKSFICTIIGCLCLANIFAQKSTDTRFVASYAKSDLKKLNTTRYLALRESYTSNYPKLSSSKYKSRKRRLIKLKADRSVSVSVIDSVQVKSKVINDSTSLIKTLNNTTDSGTAKANCTIKYSLSKNKDFKYNMHVEGEVSDCIQRVAIPHAYVSLNSAVVAGKYLIVPTSVEGKFNVDIVDDSIGSITVIKKGYSERKLNLNQATQINENTSYTFNLCLDKEVPEYNKTVAKVKQTVATSKSMVYFGFNKVTLQKDTKGLLDSLIQNIKSSNTTPTSIDLNGYADSKGSRKYNLELSRKRAIACRRYLYIHGVTDIKIRVHAYGSTNPLEKEKIDGKIDNPAARAQNRRVEIIVH